MKLAGENVKSFSFYGVVVFFLEILTCNHTSRKYLNNSGVLKGFFFFFFFFGGGGGGGGVGHSMYIET